MSNLFHQGTEVLNDVEIDGYLKDYDIQYKIFHDNKGLEYIEKYKSWQLSKTLITTIKD